MVKEKKPHKEPKHHHLHYHHDDRKKKRKSGNIKHVYIPYIPHAHGEEEENFEESNLGYSVTVPSGGKDYGYSSTQRPHLFYNNREYEILSSHTMPKYQSSHSPMVDNFYERNSEEKESQKEFYETDPYFPRPDYQTVVPSRIPESLYSNKGIKEIKGPVLGLQDKETINFKPITPSYDIYTGPDLFYPTKPSISKKNKKRLKYDLNIIEKFHD